MKTKKAKQKKKVGGTVRNASDPRGIGGSRTRKLSNPSRLKDTNKAEWANFLKDLFPPRFWKDGNPPSHNTEFAILLDRITKLDYRIEEIEKDLNYIQEVLLKIRINLNYEI
jgi:hypothetical protein